MARVRDGDGLVYESTARLRLLFQRMRPQLEFNSCSFIPVEHKSFSFAVRDSLVNVGPVKDFAYRLRINADANATGIFKQSNYELVCCSGHGKNGALCVLRLQQDCIYSIFENIDKDPLEVLQLAEKEAQLWQSAQIELHHENNGTVELETRSRVGDASLDSNYSGCRCFVDGSWKESDKFSGTGWFCTSSNGEPPTMGAANLRRSLSPLHTEFEALLWAMKCMIGADNQEVAFFTDCSDLVKMVSSPTEWPAFSVYLEEFQSDKEEFSSFSLSLISRNANVKADNLARKIRTEPFHITYVNNIPQEWLF
ncbi:Ribonuclease H domain [Arabidopsis suecica]|uniref:Ribonuclease H domain n=1 Tax=Arabidopsis suecica TaxID=45249 RepID=A0A8T1XVZ1_ARASU|nr:Ribonuclease H domain [Arabidopsis suecica]